MNTQLHRFRFLVSSALQFSRCFLLTQALFQTCLYVNIPGLGIFSVWLQDREVQLGHIRVITAASWKHHDANNQEREREMPSHASRSECCETCQCCGVMDRGLEICSAEVFRCSPLVTFVCSGHLSAKLSSFVSFAAGVLLPNVAKLLIVIGGLAFPWLLLPSTSWMFVVPSLPISQRTEASLSLHLGGN